MKWIAAGLTLVNFATVSGLILGIVSRGLTPLNTSTAFAIGVFAAILAYFRVSDQSQQVSDSTEKRKVRGTPGGRSTLLSVSERYNLSKWIVVSCCVLFAIRS